MLDELTAKNLGLIEHAGVQLGPGLTVITGETGAGKTLMLGALRLLRGDKAAKSVIGPSGPAAEVAARFTAGADELVLRRSIDGSRSRAYVDDSVSTNAGLAEASDGRIAIVGQHDQLSITTGAGARALVDAALDAAGERARSDYRTAWDHLRAIRAEIEAIGSDLRGLEREHDALAYQIEEIDGAALEEGEERNLAADLTRSRNAEALAVELDTALTSLGDEGAGAFIERARASLGRAHGLDPSIEELITRIDAIATELGELAGSLAVFVADLEVDPLRLERLEERMAVLSAMKRKYGDTIEDIMVFRKEAEARSSILAELLEASSDVEQRHRTALDAVVDVGARLRASRADTARRVAAAAEGHLQELGFEDPTVSVAVEPAEPSAQGCDRLEIRFASSSSLEPGPVSAIASGGELSRLVLALTLAAGAVDAEVVAFDEIDAGVGGTTALAMGAKLAALAEDRQVICVTHLPQVAAHADAHLVVRRTGDRAGIEQLEGDARVDEITRMLAGLSESHKGREHARELIEAAGP